MKILLTAFRPFLGQSLNPSEILLQKFIQKNDPSIICTLLPVEFKASLERVEQQIEIHKPDFILMMGQASGRKRVGLEQVALNLLDSQYADEAGQLLQNQSISGEGPVAYISDLPLRPWAEEISNLGLPCERSLSAGTYVCNYLYYSTQRLCGNVKSFEYLKNKILFIHLPLLPEQASAGEPSVSLQSMADVTDQLLDKIRNHFS